MPIDPAKARYWPDYCIPYKKNFILSYKIRNAGQKTKRHGWHAEAPSATGFHPSPITYNP
jgi:hypothetical protein